MKTVIMIVIALLFCLSCNQESVIENDLEFKEKLIIRALIEAGKPVSIYISKTLPLTLAYNFYNSKIENLDLKIFQNNIPYNLYYKDSCIYYNPQLIASNGDNFELQIRWNGNHITGKTTVPFSTTFQNAKLITKENGNDTIFYLSGILTPKANAVYGVTWLILNAEFNIRIEDAVIPEILKDKDKNLKGNLALKTRDIPKEIINKWKNSLFIRIHAFDEQYYNFFLTQDANQATNNIFNQSGINLRWNIQGNDAIGMFIGKTDYIIKVK